MRNSRGDKQHYVSLIETWRHFGVTIKSYDNLLTWYFSETSNSEAGLKIFQVLYCLLTKIKLMQMYISRSMCLEVFHKNTVLNIFSKKSQENNSDGVYSHWSFKSVFAKRNIPPQVFWCDFYDTFWTSFSLEYLWIAFSVSSVLEKVIFNINAPLLFHLFHPFKKILLSNIS